MPRDRRFRAADATLNEIDAVSASEGLAVRAALERMRLRQAVGPVPTDEVEALVERAISVFEQHHDEAGLAYAWVRMADVHWKRCRCAAMEDVLEQALVHADRAGARQEQKLIYRSLCRAAVVGPRPVPDAIRRCEEIRVRAGDGLRRRRRSP